ncbi:MULTISPECIES: DUF2058 domain-containing protein [Methylococcus]|uniref:DUF2058 domain-containing protein n=1 Tax=Methylococcus capsulatus TaxID=414 RepID=A0ABZ2F227_METCP|nr:MULTISPECIES: DUF2058 domain-containing protein [Methylococcus]MDF9391989.1 DUF2058 domain-containing protein [Methylococcus capsulatus]
MSNPLQEQLRKAGLVNDRQLKKAQKDLRKERQRSAENKGADAEKATIRQAQAEKAARDRELNLQRKEAEERKARVAQIRQLIEANRQSGDGEVAYNFADGGIVKRIYVDEAMRRRIVHGQIAIVKLDGRYELVPAEVAERIAVRDPSCIVLKNPPPGAGEENKDDPYATYPVPDDLIW